MKQVKLDERRLLFVGESKENTLQFAAKQWIELAQEAIKDHGHFAVALSGGSTPKLIYQLLNRSYKDALDWSKVWLFWSDERCVAPTDAQSNYHMAMTEGELSQLPLLKKNIFPLPSEGDLEANALRYETLIKEKVPLHTFDLIMLGMGEDGHTASLFPHTLALHLVNRLVVPNFITQKNTWRMTFTYDLINKAHHIIFYALGAEKAPILERVLKTPYNPDELPSQRVGTNTHPAWFVLDELAGKNLSLQLK